MGRELRDRERLRCKGRGLAASSARARRQEHDRGAGGLRPRASGQNPATAKQRQRNDARAQHASVSSTTHHTVPGGHEDTDYRSDLRFPARGAEGPRSRGQARLTEGSLSAETGPCFTYALDFTEGGGLPTSSSSPRSYCRGARSSPMGPRNAPSCPRSARGVEGRWV